METCDKQRRRGAGELENRSKFEWGVLVLALTVLTVMTGWFSFGSVRPADTWRVEVEHSDSPAVSAPAGEEGTPDSLLEGEVIDLNAATAADLERLPGIGAARAQDIVSYRRENGRFDSVDDLTQVDGIGTGILEQLRPYVMVG